jgi:hydroxypyruvate reductase
MMSALRFADHAQHVRRFVDAALQAADPARALAAHWSSASLDPSRPLYMVGAGKASLEMAVQLVELCGDALVDGAVAVVPERLAQLEQPPARFHAYPAAHPLPDERNVQAALAIAAMAEQASADGTLIALISGGGSAHLTLPAEGLTLVDLQSIAQALMQAGAAIPELNAVRKHCEKLKGGGLARLAHPAPVRAFVLSDVIGDPLDVIASGPFAGDSTTFADALDVLRRFDLLDAVPAVTAHLQAGARGDRPENPRPDDQLFDSVSHTIIGSNRLALEAVRDHAQGAGWHILEVEAGVIGEAREQGQRLAAMARSLPANSVRPACHLIGGETTVTVAGDGIGGRNLELALAAAVALDGLENVALAAFATDGIDGPTDAAGAIVTGGTAAHARSMGFDPQAYLANNDSYTFFKKVGGLIQTGPTGTNVNDIALVLAY